MTAAPPTFVGRRMKSGGMMSSDVTPPGTRTRLAEPKMQVRFAVSPGRLVGRTRLFTPAAVVERNE